MTQHGSHHRRVEISKAPNLSTQSPAILKQAYQEKNEELEDDSSSTASFATCPEAETFQCTPAHTAVKISVSQPTDRNLDRTTLTEAHEMSAESAPNETTKTGHDRRSGEGTSTLSSAEDEDVNHSGLKLASDLHQSLKPLRIPSIRSRKATDRVAISPLTRLLVSGKFRRPAMKAIALRTPNEVASANVAELYARFDKVRVEGWQAELLEIDAHEEIIQNLSISASTEVFEAVSKASMKCQYCGRYFTGEQNLRDFDTGLGPCFYHPGEKYGQHSNSLASVDIEYYAGSHQTAPGSCDQIHWSCCHRDLSELSSGQTKRQGCANGFHLAEETTRCRLCDQVFISQDNERQADGSAPCSYHPGWCSVLDFPC